MTHFKMCLSPNSKVITTRLSKIKFLKIKMKNVSLFPPIFNCFMTILFLLFFMYFQCGPSTSLNTLLHAQPLWTLLGHEVHAGHIEGGGEKLTHMTDKGHKK